jgi:DNA excision repair protein ERCC-3
MSVGLETQDIIEVLSRLSKIPLPRKLVQRIESWTSSYGKIRLVLKHNRYYLESTVPAFLRTLLNDEVIGPCRIVRDNEEELQRGMVPRRDFAIAGTEEARQQQQNGAAPNGAPGRAKERDDVIGAVIGIDESTSFRQYDRDREWRVTDS